jgi:hypothetical protein
MGRIHSSPWCSRGSPWCSRGARGSRSSPWCSRGARGSRGSPWCSRGARGSRGSRGSPWCSRPCNFGVVFAFLALFCQELNRAQQARDNPRVISAFSGNPAQVRANLWVKLYRVDNARLMPVYTATLLYRGVKVARIRKITYIFSILQVNRRGGWRSGRKFPWTFSDWGIPKLNLGFTGG